MGLEKEIQNKVEEFKSKEYKGAIHMPYSIINVGKCHIIWHMPQNIIKSKNIK